MKHDGNAPFWKFSSFSGEFLEYLVLKLHIEIEYFQNDFCRLSNMCLKYLNLYVKSSLLKPIKTFVWRCLQGYSLPYQRNLSVRNRRHLNTDWIREYFKTGRKFVYRAVIRHESPKRTISDYFLNLKFSCQNSFWNNKLFQNLYDTVPQWVNQWSFSTDIYITPISQGSTTTRFMLQLWVVVRWLYRVCSPCSFTVLAITRKTLTFLLSVSTNSKLKKNQRTQVNLLYIYLKSE